MAYMEDKEEEEPCCCWNEMNSPPSLMQLCENVVASLLTADLEHWKQVRELPLDMIHRILLCLPPLTLLTLSEELPSLSRQHNEEGSLNSDNIPSTSGRDFCELSGFNVQGGASNTGNRRNEGLRSSRRKRDSTGFAKVPECPTLESGLSVAWKSLYNKRWAHDVRQNSISDYEEFDCDNVQEHREVDWQQLYWEAHLQDCLNAAAATQASVSISELQLGDIPLPSDLVNQLNSNSSQNKEREIATLGDTCRHFAHHARKLRLQNIVCSPELVVLLKDARLCSIAFYNVRIRSDLTGLCDLLRHNMPTLYRVEFYHSKFSGTSLNKIGEAMCPLNNEHRLQHFALISSRIFDQTDLFAVKPPKFLHFLVAARFLRSLKLWDNALEQENVVFIMTIIFQSSKNFSFLRLADNELGEVFTRLLAKSLIAMGASKILLHRLTVLDLRSNMLDGGAVQSLAVCLEKMPSLKQLNLSDNPLEDTGIKGLVPYFKGLSNGMSSLVDLSVARCGMTSIGAAALLEALSCSQMTVRKLSIASNYLGSSVSQSLAKFLGLCTLEVLDISDIGLGHLGCVVELEEAMIYNRTLLHIDISKNRISAPGATMLASVITAGRSALTSINASSNLFSVDSISSIAAALQSQSYRRSAGTILSLDLRENPGSFLCKLSGTYDRLGSCTVLLSDSLHEAQAVIHDDDP